MIEKNEIILKELLEDFVVEKKNIENSILDSNNEIDEKKTYLDSILEEEDKNYIFFSPRNIETKHKKIIDKYNKKIEYYKKRIADYNIELCRINNYIEKLQNIVNLDKTQLDINMIIEEERNRIARDLHDSCLQNLTYIIHKIELSSLYIDKDPIKAKIELNDIDISLKNIIEDIRNVIYNLRDTPDIFNLKDSLVKLLLELKQNNIFNIESHIEDISSENPMVLECIYRVVQESINNIVKHSDGTELFISCKSINNICELLIKDNGKGFDIEKTKYHNHYGLKIMKEEVEKIDGTFNIKSQLSKGTEIFVKIPLT